MLSIGGPYGQSNQCCCQDLADLSRNLGRHTSRIEKSNVIVRDVPEELHRKMNMSQATWERVLILPTHPVIAARAMCG